MEIRFVSLFLLLAAGVAVGSRAATAPVAPRVASADLSPEILIELGLEEESADQAPSAAKSPETDKKKGAKLELSSTNINFGDVLIGHVRKRDLKLKHTGRQILVVQVADATDPAFTGSPLNRGITLKPGKTRTVHLEFTPTEKKKYIGKLPVEIISPGAAKLRVRLSGEGK